MNCRRDRSVAIVHPRLEKGGSEFRVMWAAQALSYEWYVSVLSSEFGELAEMNRFCGTSLTPSEVTFRRLSVPLISKTPRAAVLRGALLQRALRNVSQNYDLMVSAYNPVDFGVPAIQFIADFSWDEEIRHRLHPFGSGLSGAVHRNGLLRRAYLGLAKMLSAPSRRGVFHPGDLVVANSNWTATILRERYQIAKVRVIYPPVTEPSVWRTEAPRNLDFACIGRISEEKRLENVIEILARVRAQGFSVRLRMAGAFDEFTLFA